MVAAYEKFVEVATARRRSGVEEEEDADVAVLRDWTAQVRGWMHDHKLLHHVPDPLPAQLHAPRPV